MALFDFNLTCAVRVSVHASSLSATSPKDEIRHQEGRNAENEGLRMLLSRCTFGSMQLQYLLAKWERGKGHSER